MEKDDDNDERGLAFWIGRGNIAEGIGCVGFQIRRPFHTLVLVR